MRAFLTPNNPSANVTCRRFRLPASADFLSLFVGALTPLLYAKNYEQFGDMTPEDTAQVFKLALLEMEDEPNCMLGEIKAFLFTPLPPNVLPCDGQVYQRADYPRLYEYLPVSFRVSDDAFVTPNLQRRGLVGWDIDGLDQEYTLGWEIGQASQALTVDNMPAHIHETVPHSHTDVGHTHFRPNSPGVTILAVAPGEAPVLTPSLVPGQTTIGNAQLTSEAVTVLEAGGGTPFDIRNPDTVCIWAIVAR